MLPFSPGSVARVSPGGHSLETMVLRVSIEEDPLVKSPGALLPCLTSPLKRFAPSTKFGLAPSLGKAHFPSSKLFLFTQLFQSFDQEEKSQ